MRQCGNTGKLLLEWTLLRQCGNTGKLLLEWTLLRQCGNTGKAGKTEKTPAGADAAAAVWECRKGSCGSGHCCGSVEMQGRLLRERALLRQCRSIEKAPAGADTAAAVGRNREKRQVLLQQWGNLEKAPAGAGCCWGGVQGDCYGGSKDRVNGDRLELKGVADENSVSFFDMEAV
ncbi:hypothetical protein ROHU_028570 [Labeo rohita]|uniref:Uncharacterized protein n=1 Tax=Labeo rohita TaxID=84645 RepID=A0A498M1I5_LABRO|nr:hypothetical protein ROHU_028570 [Labeo rohita]